MGAGVQLSQLRVQRIHLFPGGYVVPADAVAGANPRDGAPLEVYEAFASRSHFSSTTLLAKPFKRLTARI